MSSSTPLSSDADSQEDVKQLNELLIKYKALLEDQAEERDELLHKVEMITDASKNVKKMDVKMDNLVDLLKEIKEQVMHISSTSDVLEVQNIDGKMIQNVANEVEIESERLMGDINRLREDISLKENELEEKDNFINELNDQLEQLAFEKSQLITKLESLNSLTEKWNEEITLLQKLAVSDPRYKAIDTLKKHGSLSEIQLAFSMGTSINQVKRYAEDLIKLNMIRRDNSGRYVWINDNQ